jgi:hypothetical protein
MWFGLPYEFWSLAVFVSVEALAVWALMRDAGQRR